MIPVVKLRRLSQRARITTVSGLAVALAIVTAAADADRVVAMPTISSTAIAFEPEVRVDQAVLVPEILPSAVASAPSVVVSGVTISVGLIVSTGAAHPPIVTSIAAAAILPPAILSTSTAPAPLVTVGGVAIVVPMIASTTIVRAPTVAPGVATIIMPMVASGAVAQAPTVIPGAASVSLPLIASTAALYAPSVTVAAAGFDSDAAAYFAAMTVQPDATRKARVNDLIVGGKADGWWSKMDWFALLAMQTSQQALLNARMPSKQLQAVNSPTFTADRGFTGDGATSHLSFNEAFNATGNLFALASANIGAWCNLMSAATGPRPHIGSSQSTRTFMSPSTGSSAELRVNDSSASYFDGTTRVGHRTGVRADGTTKKYYRDGVNTQTFAVTGGAVATGPAFLLRNGAIYADDRLAAAYSGGGLTDADVANIHARLNTFLTSYGAN